MKLYAPWEKAFNKISTPFEHFIHAQNTAGVLLILATILSLILANSPISDSYINLFHTQANISVGSWGLSQTIHDWINDGLMAAFFFLIGLEIKREVLFGELASIKAAMLPILCAIGGMAFPIIIYYFVNSNGDGANGWGIPVATDIAFAIGILVLLGKKIPATLITFLVALAIIDDLGSIAIIAIFYTDQIHTMPLILAGLLLLVLIAFNRFGIRTSLPYFIVNLLLWFFLLQSGIHATTAGVIAAIAIPSIPKHSPLGIVEYTKELLNKYNHYPVCENHMPHEKQKAILISIHERIDAVRPPSSRLIHKLHLPVALFVLPVFALTNTAIVINLDSIALNIFQPVSVGIILGLILGKVIGIFGVAWLAIKFKIAQLPRNSSISQIFGVALLGGIGFTMSLFITNLAFVGNPELVYQAKIGVLFASLFSSLAGYLWLKCIAKNNLT